METTSICTRLRRVAGGGPAASGHGAGEAGIVLSLRKLATFSGGRRLQTVSGRVDRTSRMIPRVTGRSRSGWPVINFAVAQTGLSEGVHAGSARCLETPVPSGHVAGMRCNADRQIRPVRASRIALLAIADPLAGMIGPELAMPAPRGRRRGRSLPWQGRNRDRNMVEPRLSLPMRDQNDTRHEPAFGHRSAIVGRCGPACMAHASCRRVRCGQRTKMTTLPSSTRTRPSAERGVQWYVSYRLDTRSATTGESTVA